jgi:probable HAF family extracellular repeat protein
MCIHASKPKLMRVRVVVLAAAAACALATPASAVQHYIATPLGSLGGTESQGYGINYHGQVTGRSYIAGNAATHAFLYSAGAMTDLGTLGGTNSAGYGINNTAQVSGSSLTKGEGGPHAFLYSGGTKTDLGTLGPRGDSSAGYGINNTGQVTGVSVDYPILSKSLPAYIFRSSAAFIYSGGKMTYLGWLGGYNSVGYGINDRGQVTGWSDTTYSGGTYHAFLYSGGTMTDLGTLGGTNSAGYGINNTAQVTGTSFTKGEGGPHAFLYSGGVMTDLGTLGGAGSVGNGINDRGQMVGYAGTASGSLHAFLYFEDRMYDLNSLVVSGLGAAVLTEARAINANGQIIANACPNNASCTAYLLDPVAEPAAATDVPTLSRWVLAATALLLLAGGWLGLRGASKGSRPWARVALRRNLRE